MAYLQNPLHGLPNSRPEPHPVATDIAMRIIREARCRISHSLDNDPQRLVRYYQTMQAAFDGRLISGPDLPHEFADPERPSDSND